MAFFFDCSSLEIQNSSSVLRFLGRQLFSNFLNIFWMEIVKNATAEPFILWLIQNRRDRIRDIDDAPCVTSDDKEESICCFEDKVL